MITIDATEAIAVLNGMAARMANTKPVLAQIGELMASKVMLGIMEGKDDPEGRPWAEWKPRTLRERTIKGNVPLGLLRDQGTLLGSIRVQASKNEVDIGTPMIEGKWLQIGTDIMAARPFLGWSEADKGMTEQFVANYIEGLSL